MSNIEKATEHVYQQPVTTNTGGLHLSVYLTVPSSLTSEMIRIRDHYRFMYRRHVYDLEKRRGNCLMKWLIMLGFTDLRWPRVCRRLTPVLCTIACASDRFNSSINAMLDALAIFYQTNNSLSARSKIYFFCARVS